MELIRRDAVTGADVYRIPQHYRDDGKWCRWSNCETIREDGQCPDRCKSNAPEDNAVEELRAAAEKMPTYLLLSSECASAVGELLDTAANRLEAHPSARGGMTQASLKIARIVNG